jgi:hypothetical protein
MIRDTSLSTNILPEPALYSLDEAYKKLGGFGRAQLLSTILLCVFRNTGLTFIYMWGFITMP